MSLRYREALADPQQLQRMTAMAAHFEVLSAADAADPRPAELAEDLAMDSLQFPDDQPHDDAWKPAWQALLVTLPPAQRRCMELGWQRRQALVDAGGA